MTFTILHKRSNVASHVPNTTQLALGEVAVNTYDGLLYFVRQQNTTNTVETISPLPPSITLTGGVTGSANFSGSNAITITTTVLTATTQPVGDSTTNVATTAFVAGAYLPVSGGTMTGDFTVANAAANANAAATRFHVDATTNGVVTGRVSLVANPAGGSAIDIFGPAPTGIQAFSSISPSSQIWLIELNTGAATGNNTGDNYTITPFDDTGAALPVAQTIYRSNGVTVFGNTIVTVTQPTTDNTTNVATTAFVKSTAGNYMPIAGGTFTGSVAISSGNTLTVNGAVFALSTINALNQVAATGGLYNLSPTANTINYTQVNVYDGNTGGYYINNAGGVNRWSFITSAAVGSQATNANTGADLTFTAWTGAGSPPATATNVLTLYRGNAVAAFSNTITTITQPLSDATSNVATTAFVKSANATQISRYVTGTIGTSSGTYTITPSNAVPVSPFTGWGTLWTASITPTSTSSKIRIAFNISFSVSIARTMLFLITRGTTVIGMAGQYGATTLQMFSHSMDVIDSPATTSTTTYTCYYAGQVTAGTVYWNQQGGSTAYTYGSAMTSSYSLQDV